MKSDLSAVTGRRIAIIGLGIMGRPMALNLVTAGFDVVGYSRSDATREAFSAAGGRVATGLAAAILNAVQRLSGRA